MIYAAYNGVPMRSLGEVGYSRQLLLSEDQVVPLGVHVEFQGVFAVNSGLMGSNDLNTDRYDPDLEGANLIVPDGQLSVPELLLLIEARLEVPRKPLVLWSYVSAGAGPPKKVVLLRSPPPLPGGARMANFEQPQPQQPVEYAEVDIRVGPTPTLSWVNFDHGSGTALVGFAVATDIPLRNDHDAVLLANQWEMKHGLDQDYYSIHEVTGRAVFRKDLLKFKGTTPDLLRHMFVHPVPLGFRRHQIDVRQDPTGHAVDYFIQDVEQPADQPGVGAYGASRVEVVHQREHSAPTPLNFITPS